MGIDNKIIYPIDEMAHLRLRLFNERVSLGRLNPRLKLNKQKATLFASLMTLILLVCDHSISVCEAVDCFKCTSRNGSNPDCEDPFHNLNTTRINSPILPDRPPNVIYHTPCYAGKKGRDGLFPASACIKLTGTFDNTGEKLLVRHCALDSGTLTQDTEIARMSHCGKFNFDGDSLQGCVLACPEDACNGSLSGSHLVPLPLVLGSLLWSVGQTLAWRRGQAA